MQNQQKMMKQLQQMQSRMAAMQEELDSAEVMGSAGGGAVTATANGQQRLLSITIAPEALEGADSDDEARDTLHEMILAACNAALDASRELAAQQMSRLTAGLGLPPGLV